MSKGNDLIERLREPLATEKTMQRWDAWRRYHMDGGKATWTRDEFESLLESLDEDRCDALATIASLSEALAEAEKKGAEDGWMPIETAPRDAEAVLITGGTWLYSESFADGMCDWTAIATFDPNASGDHKWNGGNGTEYDGIYYHNPTHWRPLPPPPRDLSQGGQP
ncbi:DUF551 domain-containing protein [Aureimonas sp. AU20]|uniref:DUF551 domain-containing protein n=1 Tax=Aureimonas sp. AU20 TaxID=1349819 RepID=UPI00071F3715|nr:DUF551 domain-containing protein [Aureimonas sp. AU20]ALN73570.1 hypothetical protein M673_12650 [Aureimonas sp. AU20]